jgi:hypothetical protein
MLLSQTLICHLVFRSLPPIPLLHIQHHHKFLDPLRSYIRVAESNRAIQHTPLRVLQPSIHLSEQASVSQTPVWPIRLDWHQQAQRFLDTLLFLVVVVAKLYKRQYCLVDLRFLLRAV